MSERKRQQNVAGGRPVTRKLTLTPVQDGQLTVAAERAGRTVPAFLVEAGLKAGGFQTETERRESIFALFQLREQLARIGNNLNQMARLLNSEGKSTQTCARLWLTFGRRSVPLMALLTSLLRSVKKHDAEHYPWREDAGTCHVSSRAG